MEDPRFIPIILRKPKKEEQKHVQQVHESKTLTYDHATEAGSVKKVSKECSQSIITARCAKKMKQTDLAKVMNVLPRVVQDFECGKAVIDHALLQKFRKALGVKIPS